jgi:hypothetical protein
MNDPAGYLGLAVVVLAALVIADVLVEALRGWWRR